jgi:predicted RND superfamily exporter protein
VAWLVIDEERIQKNQKCLPKCDGKKCTETPCIAEKCKITGNIWTAFTNLLDSKIYHGVIFVLSAAIIGIGVWGCLTIKQDVDMSRWYPAGSYFSKWLDAFIQHFDGWDYGFAIYTGSLKTKDDFVSLDNMTNTLSNWINNGEALVSMDNWWQQFNLHINDYWNITDWKTLFDSTDEKDLQYYLSEFLYSPNGGKYISVLRFNESLSCNRPAPFVTASSIPFKYLRDYDLEGKNYNRKLLEDHLHSLNTTAAIFSYGLYYFIWDADEFVGIELWRNLGVAMLCIFIVTFLLLNNFLASALVNISVVISMVNVVGFAGFWDISMDTVSLCTVVVVVGICVDYPVHIVHCYMVSSGNYIG